MRAPGPLSSSTAAAISRGTQGLGSSPDPEKETPSNSMSLRPQRCDTLLKWRQFERWLRVRDVHGLPELLETGPASFVGVNS